jgi:hypothetical protein
MIVAQMRQRKYALRNELVEIPGLRFRRILDPDGDSGPFLIMIWKDRETCLSVVEKTRNAGVKTGPDGLNNVPLSEWGLHIYYNNVSLAEKRALSTAGRPWNDPLNHFAARYEYQKGTLPVMDGLVERSSLLAIPPVMSETVIEAIAKEFQKAAG